MTLRRVLRSSTHTVTPSGLSDDPVLTVLSQRRSFVIYNHHLTVESLDFARSVASQSPSSNHCSCSWSATALRLGVPDILVQIHERRIRLV